MSQLRPKIQRPSCRPFNSITIPRVQPKSHNRQLCKSTILLVPISTSNIQPAAASHSCSSSTPYNGDLFQFSKALLECKTFFEKEKRSLIVIENQTKRKTEKTVCFERIHFMINNSQFLSNLPENYFNDLMITISTIFNLETNQTIPSTLVYSDLPVYMRYTHFEEMNIIYDVFSIILNKKDAKNLQTMITKDFFRKFIKLLDNPDISERKIIEGLVFQISTVIPSQRSFILSCLFNLLQDHIDKIIPYFCVSTVLQCISNIMLFPEIKVADYQKSIILYLLNSYFLDSFSWDMDELLKKLYELYPEYSEKVRTFLIFNWPNKDSQNSYYFLSFYISSLSRTKFTESNSSSSNSYSIIVQKFYDCILSDNVSNSLQAVNFAGSASVYKIMTKICPNFYKGFFESIKQIKTAWSPFINQAIADSSKKIKELEELSTKNAINNKTQSPIKNSKRENKKFSWDDIKKMVNGEP